jgi:P pilus assembly chaperone PapD
MSPVPANARALTGRPVGTDTRWGRNRALTGLLALLLWMPVDASAQLGVDQLEVTFKQHQGPAAAQTFQVSNGGSTAIQVTIARGDWDRGEDGQNRFFPPGTAAGSCHEALTVFPTTLRVEPGRSEAVRVDIRPGIKVPCQSILFVETPPPAGGISGST